MTVEVRDGWLHGELEDDTGKAWPIVRFRQASARGPMLVARPNYVLHTTETLGYVEHMKFPSQYQCGEGMIGQHIMEGLAGDSVNDWDRHAMQLEMVERVADRGLALYLPQESTLGPAVALTAWLHRTRRIKTGLKRPDGQNWPVILDRGPQAVERYYRRHANLWPNVAGVYGHVDIPGNHHWDPGSFNYPAFFRRVAAAIAVQEGDMAILTDSEQRQLRNLLRTLKEDLGTKTAIGTATRIARSVAKTEAPADPTDGITLADADARYARKDHPHEVPDIT